MATTRTDDLRLPADTHIGHVHLKVRDLERSLSFYRDLLGLVEVGREGRTVWLAPRPEGPVLIVLTALPNAQPKPRGTTGLYHVAIRFLDRRALALTFRRLAEARWPFHGFSDHKVSEAIYLPDPDGNGLELYRDKPRDQWPWQGDQLFMRTDPLDVDALLAEADGHEWTGIAAETDIGHVHVHVRDLDEAERFYHGILGLNVTQRTYPGARFFAAGRYHHHVGTNIWAGRHAVPPPPTAVGLAYMTLVVPDPALVPKIRERAMKGGCLVTTNGQAFLAHDAAGNLVWVTAVDTADQAPAWLTSALER